MDINVLRTMVTLAVIAAFFGVVWWAYRPGHKARFERDALLPFDEAGDEPASEDPSKGIRP